jgi:hypothetical protein
MYFYGSPALLAGGIKLIGDLYEPFVLLVYQGNPDRKPIFPLQEQFRHSPPPKL